MAETKATEVKAVSEAVVKKTTAKLKAKNITNGTLYLVNGSVEPGSTIEVTPAEFSCFEGKYLEKV